MLPRTLVMVATLLCASVATAEPMMMPPKLSVHAVDTSPRPQARRMKIPKARWGTAGGRTNWSVAALAALRGPAANLPEIVPTDISTWCPTYETAGRDQREAFWVGLVSTLAKHESTYRPAVVGGGGRWYGLLQILPSTARAYGCQARSGEALKNPALNLSCGLRIMARTVARDGVVSQNMRGVAADWGPFHSRTKREDMIAWTRSQPFCTGLARSLRPVPRPDAWSKPVVMAEARPPIVPRVVPAKASVPTTRSPILSSMGHAEPVLPNPDGVITYNVNGAILRPSQMSAPVIATSGSLLPAAEHGARFE
ncbi:transglycosylase SLT domain-containing protein [Salipiger pallidus]|nr:transglycosylase SLT domain-containing protein [Salipiger pallidus]